MLLIIIIFVMKINDIPTKINPINKEYNAVLSKIVSFDNKIMNNKLQIVERMKKNDAGKSILNAPSIL